MISRIFFYSMVIAALAGCGQGQKKSNQQETQKLVTADNSQNSLDWTGSYRGMLPCADCSGIETIITLRADSTFRKTSKYLGKGSKTFEDKGSFRWNKQGNKITLQSDSDGAESATYLVGEHKLIQLDQQGNRVTGPLADHYVLGKSVRSITDTYWKLVRLEGKTITPNQHQRKEAHFVLKPDSNEVIGNGGCNIFHGRYKRSDEHRITFSQVVSTKMACQNVDYENDFLKALSKANGYELRGDTLVLKKSGRTLARFVRK